MSHNYGRKIFHLILGVILGLLIIYVRKRYIIAVLTGLISAGVLIRLFLLKGFKFGVVEHFLRWFGRPNEIGMGAMFFFIGALISILFFQREYAGVGVLVLGISDGLSAIFGMGSVHKLYNNKSFEGTIAFFISSFIIILFFDTLFQAVATSLLLSLIELFSPVDDNIIIPPSCALIISLLRW
ncbi:Uncharacterised protein [Candidatus Tiddalikarchaeum anstoanum]|nr:Uncharacterised protein [Candidatus Tiddalikarchaeum anstoanum]